MHRASAWIAWITPKGFPSACAASNVFWKNIRPYREKFTFVQIGAPSRSHIKRYHDLQDEVTAEVQRINERFGTRSWKPIVFLNRHHSHDEIGRLLSCRRSSAW